MVKIIIFFILIAMLSGCANSVVVPDIIGTDESFSSMQIETAVNDHTNSPSYITTQTEETPDEVSSVLTPTRAPSPTPTASLAPLLS